MPKNIDIPTRTEILRIGWRIQDAGVKVTGGRISRLMTHRITPACALRWWKRRHTFQRTGELKHKPRSGRPTHTAFDTTAKVQEVQAYCQNLKEGEHVADVCAHFGCSRQTLRRHTRKLIYWKLPPKKEAAHTPLVSKKRLEFAQEMLGINGKCLNKYSNAAHLDHKYWAFWGVNRQQQRQAQARKGPNPPMRPQIRELHAPKLHVLGAEVDGDFFGSAHAHLAPLKKDTTDFKVENRTVTGVEMASVIEDEVGPWLIEHGVELVFMDCAPVNHCSVVTDAFNALYIQVYPTAARSLGGYPPYSHDCSILDGYMYGDMANSSARICLHASALNNVSQKPIARPNPIKRDREVYLYKFLPNLFDMGFIQDLAKSAFAKYPSQMQKIIDFKGEPTYL